MPRRPPLDVLGDRLRAAMAATRWRALSDSPQPLRTPFAIVFAAIGIWLVAAAHHYAAEMPFEFNEAYNFQIVRSLTSSFCYCTVFQPTIVFPIGGSTNGLVYYVGALFFAATHHDVSATIVGTATVGMAFLLASLWVLEPWLVGVAALLLLSWRQQDASFLLFQGEIWAVAFTVLGVVSLRRIGRQPSLASVLRSKEFILAALCFGLAMESKLVAIAATAPIPFAIFYRKFADWGEGGSARRALALATAACGACFFASLLALLLLIEFSVLHSVRNPAGVSQGVRTFAGFIVDMFVGHGQLAVQASDSTNGLIAAIAALPLSVLVLLLVALIAMLWENPGYVPFALATLALCATLLPADQRYAVISFDLTILLGALAVKNLLVRLARRMHWRVVFVNAGAAALAVVVVFACNNATRARFFGDTLDARAAAGLTLASNTVDLSVGPYRSPYIYSPKLVEALENERYVLASSWWQMPEISSRYGLVLYDRMALVNAHLWARQPALLFDTYNRGWPITSRGANCATTIFVDGPIVLCRMRKDVPLDYQADGFVAPPLTETAPLGRQRWRVTPGLHPYESGGDSSGGSFEYHGTGAPDTQAATLDVGVRPGRVYVFSAWVDPSAVVNGEVDLFIDTPSGNSTYSISYIPGQAPSRYLTEPWLCPAGVTRVMLGVQIVRTTVAMGRAWRFSDPVLTFSPVELRPPRGR